MRQTTITKICDQCKRTLKPDSYNKNDLLTVSGLQIQSTADSRANLHVSALTDSELLDFCSPYCLKEYVDEHFKACHAALAKSDLEGQIAQDDLTDALADKEPGELL